MARVIQANYDSLKQIQQSFVRQSEQTQQLLQAVKQLVDQLSGGAWVGVGAEAFYSEMGDLVLPAMDRLVNVLGDASSATGRIHDALSEAEQEAAALFKDGGIGSGLMDAIGGIVGGLFGEGAGGEGGLLGQLFGGSSSSGGLGDRLLDAVKDYFGGTKTASDIVTTAKNLLEHFGKDVPKLGLFSTLFGGAVDTWEQLNKGRSLYDAGGIAVTKWGVETLLFRTPQGKLVELVNDAGQLAWKVIPGAVDWGFDKLGASDSMKALISEGGKTYAANIGNMDIKNVTRDFAATLWNAGRLGRAAMFGTDDVSTTGKQFFNSAGDLASTVSKFSGALWKTPDAAWDYGGAVMGGLLNSGVNVLPISSDLKNSLNSGIQSSVEMWRDIPSPTKAVGEGFEWLGDKYKSGLNWVGSALFD